VVGRDGASEELLFRDDRALLRVPQLAIHLDRDVNEKGLMLDRARHLTPIWGLGATSEGDFAAYLAEQVGVIPADVLAWEVMLHDLTPAALLGGEGELIASARLDNLCSCYGAVRALVDAAAATGASSGATGPAAVPVIALFDHEEVGSGTATGASGALLPAVLARMVTARGGSDDDLRRSLASSRCLSADMAHGTHPNYPERHDIDHPIRLGAGPVIKINMAQRYATSATSAGELRRRCDEAGVPLQVYAHRNDLPCGSTIGPLTAAGLAVDVVDVGMAQLSMHSAREVMAAVDDDLMVRGFAACL
jgi:aspartyl aminopeptidase